MKVGFRDPRTQRLFNQYERLEAYYGAALALKVAARMAVLSAAKDLSMLPRSPPISFRDVVDGEEGCCVDLGPTHRLRFVGFGVPGLRSRGKAEIDSVEVLGVERISGDHLSRRRV